MVFGTDLTEADYRDLAARGIDRGSAVAAGLRHVDTLEGRDLVGAPLGRSADYSGIGIPMHMPGNGDEAVAWRLRRANPEIDAKTGKALRKYVGPAGERNSVYFPKHARIEDLRNPEIPVVVVEGQLKVIALWKIACAATGLPRFIPLGIIGVWGYRGKVGIEENANGERVPVKGVIPDFDLLVYANRNVIVAFDQDIPVKRQVLAARWAFSVEMRERGANVGYLEWDAKDGKGPDDWLAKVGPDVVLAAIARVEFNTAAGWRAKLLCSETGKPKALANNACVALEGMPEFAGLALDEFSGRIRRPRGVPWESNNLGEWSDNDTLKLMRLLQQHHIEVGKDTAADAVEIVASQHRFHPVREYLNALQWDGEPRVDDWLSRYAGVKLDPYTSAAGRCWLVSAVARIYQPGCKADIALVLIGPEGQRKSTLCRILGEPWFSDNIPDLSEKDAQLHMIGHWILELQELAALTKAALTQVKSFMSRCEDIYRPPYGRQTVHEPRQCVFIATTNEYEPLKDTTGNRRWWPVEVGLVDSEALRADKDQIWAEAVALFRDGTAWHLTDSSVIEAATREQAARVDAHVWLDRINKWCSSRQATTVAEILDECIHKEVAHQTQADKLAVVRCLQSMKWGQARRRIKGAVARVYLNPEWLEGEDEQA